MIQRNTTSVKQKQSSRIKLYPGNVDKCMHICTSFRYIRTFTLWKNVQKQLCGSNCKVVKAFQALFNNAQLDVVIPLIKGQTFFEPLLQDTLGSITHGIPGTQLPVSISLCRSGSARNGSAFSLGSPVTFSVRGTNGLSRRQNPSHTYAYLGISCSGMKSVFSPSLQVSLFLLLAQVVTKALFMSWRAGGVCFQLAEILHQHGGCVSATITDAQNLLTYMKQRGGKGLIRGRKAH